MRSLRIAYISHLNQIALIIFSGVERFVVGADTIQFTTIYPGGYQGKAIHI